MWQNASKFLMDSRLSTGCGTSTCMRRWLSSSERSSLCYAAVPLEMLFNSAQSPVLSQQLFWIQSIGILPFIEKQLYNFAPKSESQFSTVSPSQSDNTCPRKLQTWDPFGTTPPLSLVLPKKVFHHTDCTAFSNVITSS